MASATSSANSARLLLARISDGESDRQLAGELTRRGFRVMQYPGSIIGAHGSPSALNDLLDGVDRAVVVVRKADERHDRGPVKPLQAVLREAGVLQGRLGFDRVLLLVEDTVEGLGSDPGVGIVRFPPGRPDQAVDRLASRLGSPVGSSSWVGAGAATATIGAAGTPDGNGGVRVGPDAEATTVLDDADSVPAWKASSAPPPPPEPRDDLGIAAQLASIEREDTHSRAAVLALLGVVVLAALLAMFVSIGRFGGEDTARAQDVATGLRVVSPPNAAPASPGVGLDEGGQVVVGDGSDADGSAAQAAGAEGGSPDGVVLGGVQVGSEGTADGSPGGVAGDGSANDVARPARCELALSKDLLLDDGATCEGVGLVELTGWAGPWHNDLRAVVASDGVVGYLVYEQDGQRVEIVPGLVVLDEARAAYGIEVLVLGFNAEGQHVHLLNNPATDPGDGTGATTLTFGLGGP